MAEYTQRVSVMASNEVAAVFKGTENRNCNSGFANGKNVLPEP